MTFENAQEDDGGDDEEPRLEGITPKQKELLERLREEFNEHFDGWVFVVLVDVHTKPVQGYGGGKHQAIGLLAETMDDLIRN